MKGDISTVGGFILEWAGNRFWGKEAGQVVSDVSKGELVCKNWLMVGI